MKWSLFFYTFIPQKTPLSEYFFYPFRIHYSLLTPRKHHSNDIPLVKHNFYAKQSLSQNFLNDKNVIHKITRTFLSTIHQNKTLVLELGPGSGALTFPLIDSFQDTNHTFQCIEIDNRFVSLLKTKNSGLSILHDNALHVNYTQLCQQKKRKLSIIGNLPYHITSQILFTLLNHYACISSLIVMIQYEVARRIIAPIKHKDYGILSVVFQLFANCKIYFTIPPTVFYPKPKVQSALLGIQFHTQNDMENRLKGVNPGQLRCVIKSLFQNRRKKIRNGLKGLTKELNLDIENIVPEYWLNKRPEELSALQFVDLTIFLFDCRNSTRKYYACNNVW